MNPIRIKLPPKLSPQTANALAENSIRGGTFEQTALDRASRITRTSFAAPDGVPSSRQSRIPQPGPLRFVQGVRLDPSQVRFLPTATENARLQTRAGARHETSERDGLTRLVQGVRLNAEQVRWLREALGR